MVLQSDQFMPGFAAIVAPEDCREVGAGVGHPWLCRSAGRDRPDGIKFADRAVGQDRQRARLERRRVIHLRPRLASVVRSPDRRAVDVVPGTGQDAPTRQCRDAVDAPSREQLVAELPFARVITFVDEGTSVGAYKDSPCHPYRPRSRFSSLFRTVRTREWIGGGIRAYFERTASIRARTPGQPRPMPS
ncbi:MAG: hypothetical protein EBV45_13180 [Chloroflexi bacterium]|nr:hypothetical protein [Chloroflexota bacterium]